MTESVIHAPTLFQQQVLQVPEGVDLVLDGGRGGGKSVACAYLILQHALKYGVNASILYVRQSFSGLRDFERTALNLFKAADPELTHNIKDGIFRFSNGAVVELTQATTVAQSYASKLQGRSFSLLLVDETGAYADHELIDALRSNLRAPKGVPVRMVLAMNPNGAGHLACLKRFIRRLQPFKIMALEGFSDAVVRLPSTFRDNEALNREQYERVLEQSSANDPSRLLAWRDGDWEAGRSNLFFSAQFDEERNVIPSFHAFPPGARPFLSIDWGSAKPAYCGLFASFPRGLATGGLYLPPKSVVLLDETHTALSAEALNVGSGATAEEWSTEILKLWADWDLPGRPHGVCDDAMTFKPGGRNSPSIADQFKASGVDLRAAVKGRREWSQMRSMLANAGRSQTEPGLFFCPQAEYALATIPFLSRDQRRADDLNSTSPDHAADAIRYALLGAGFRTESVKRRIGTYYADPNAWAAKLDAEIAFHAKQIERQAERSGTVRPATR